MPGRTYTAANDYRYGFNGKEKDKNISSLTAYDYGFRIYNPAIGKFLSVDPLTSSYPWYTAYQFAGNKPIIAKDLDGLEEVEVYVVAKDLYNPALQKKASDAAKKNPSALAAMQKTAWNKVVTDLDVIVTKHFDVNHNANPDWSGISKDVGNYVHNASANSSMVTWNSFANYDYNYVTTDDVDKTIDEKVNELVNDHFFAAAVGNAYYDKYVNEINQAKDPNQKAALIEDRGKSARKSWSNAFYAMQLGILTAFMAGYGLEAGGEADLKTPSFPKISLQTETVVLGKYAETGEYVAYAKKLGAKYFNIAQEIWEKWTPEERWAANQKFLDEAITKGAKFELSHSAFSAVKGSSFWKELQYMYSKGYKPTNDGMSLIKQVK